MTSFALLSCLLTAALFDIQDIPLKAEAHPFLAASSGANGALYVLDDHTITAYPAGAESRSVLLRPGTSAFDIVDFDHDGQAEVIAICGEQMMKYVFSIEEEEPQTVFRLNTQFSGHAPRPYPYALTVEKEGQRILALPCEDTFEVRALDGTPIAGYPIGENAPRRISYGHPFQTRAIIPTQTAPQNAVENQVERTVDFQPELPSDLIPVDSVPIARRATVQQTREAADLDATDWPWFQLAPDGSGMQRVLYALAPPDYRDTLVRIRTIDLDERVRDADDSITPPKRYPGIVIVLDTPPPDFNKDGHADLLLWSSAEPLLSVDSLANTVATGTWPIALSVHLFSPEKRRYEPAPAARINTAVPIAWLISPEANAPIRHCVLQDFNGDGRTDFGCSLASSSYSVWLYTESGFSQEPDFQYQTRAPITGLAFQADLENTGRTTIGLKTQSALHILRPNSERGTRNAEF